MSEMKVASLVESVRRQLSGTIVRYGDTASVKLAGGAVNVEVTPGLGGDGPLVDLADRLADIMGSAVVPDDEVATLDYTYAQGQEDARYGRHGEIRHSGVYHPSTACEGGGVCKLCGCTLEPAY